MIPKIIHQTAPEDRAKWDPSWVKYQQSWINQFPDFSYKFWNDDDIDNLVFTKHRWFYNTYKNYDQNIKRVDAARYFILYEYGGLYADMDYECIKNFWSTIDQDNISFAESGGISVANVENALIVSPQQDYFWQLVFARLIQNSKHHVFEATGPIFIEKCINEYYNETKHRIKYLDRNRYSLNSSRSGKYAVHHQTGVWSRPQKTIPDKVIYHDNISDYTVSVSPHGWEDAFEINVYSNNITVKRLDCDSCGWGLHLNLTIEKKSTKSKITHSVGSHDASPINLDLCLDTLFDEQYNKLVLKNTTLVCIDDIDIDRAVSAINKTLFQCSFDKVVLLTSLSTDYPNAIKIDPIRSIEEYSVFCIKELHKFIDTKYLLMIQYDGYVVDSSKWRDEFYNYDYVGGVCCWPDDENKGGNGGVCFRSKKLLEKASEIIPLHDCHPEDVALSGKVKGLYPTGISANGYRLELETLGFKFATNDIQKYFSYEDGEYMGTFAHHKGNTEQAYYNKIKEHKG